MALTRRRFVVAAGMSTLAAMAAQAARRRQPPVAAAVPALRPPARGTSARRCARCGSAMHSTLDATCPEAAETRLVVQTAARRMGERGRGAS